ncbi:MAG TPA: OsmC family protein [Solirubrobacteraceae bacterium]|nr:OsmC family protein [Solirubrobacteraceae bacterium]
MDREELKATQRPLKERYQREPLAALVTLHAEGQLAGTEIACSVATGRALVKAGLHQASGGTGTLACSGDMLLQALAACTGVTLRSVASSMGIEVSGRVHTEGDLDFRGTLGVRADDEPPVGFREIRVFLELESDADEEQLDTLVRLTERYCVVYQTLRGGVRIHIERY